MLRGLFVTGTDTGIGKTVTSAALMCRYRHAAPLRYWKPVQTGIEQDDDTAEIRRLARCADHEILAQGVRLPRPVSPHLAARWAAASIRIEDLVRLIHAQSDSECWIVEGAGGVLVPLNESELMIDLMHALALPVVVTARSSLGTINHTLLTIEALRARSLCVAGVVMIGEKNPDNRAAIEQYGRVPVLGEMPFWEPLEPRRLAEWAAAELDPQNHLLVSAEMSLGAAGKSARATSWPRLQPAASALLPTPAVTKSPGVSTSPAAMSGLVDRDRACLWHPYTQARTAPPPLPIARAEGVYLYTEDGRRILDGISSWWVNIHGHSHPRLNEALAAQAREMEHVVFAGCTHRPAVMLAERLLALLPKGLTRIFYSDDGSTAVEVALKLAFQYWRNRGQPQRRTFVALHHGYHGDTVGTMSVSEDSIFTRAFAPLLFPVARAHPPYCYRCPLNLQRATCRIECLGDLEQLLKNSGDRVAAVLLEPMLQAAGGMIVWPAEYLAGARRLCDQYGTLLIADEVMTGFGRTGRMFACEHAGIRPDLMCLSKGLTAGYMPLAATAATEALYEAFLSEDRGQTFFHGHSYTANPLACAVGLASLDLFRENAVLDRVKALEQQLRAGLEPLRALPCVGDVRVIGGVGIVELQSASAGYLDQLGPRLAAAFLDRGILLRPLGNILYFMPPYVITEVQTAGVLADMAEVLAGI